MRKPSGPAMTVMATVMGKKNFSGLAAYVTCSGDAGASLAAW